MLKSKLSVIMLVFTMVFMTAGHVYCEESGGLFSEDWEAGINASVWKTWGDPLPYIAEGYGIDESKAVNPNGDGYYQSGLTSYERFTLQEGLHVGAWLNTDQTSTYHQNIRLCLTDLDASETNDQNQGIPFVSVYLVVETDVQEVRYHVESEMFIEPYNVNDDGVYHYYNFIINCDRTVSFYKDGNIKWTSTTKLNFSSHSDATLTISGRSSNTMMLADNIILSWLPCPCEGDFDGDGDVDGSDLAIFAADFGRTDCPISITSSLIDEVNLLKREIERQKAEIDEKDKAISILKGK